jgi:hypothetical protein
MLISGVQPSASEMSGWLPSCVSLPPLCTLLFLGVGCRRNSGQGELVLPPLGPPAAALLLQDVSRQASCCPLFN